MTILRGKTQQFREILKSSYLGNGNKCNQTYGSSIVMRNILIWGISDIMVNTYIGVRVKNCNHVGKQMLMSKKFLCWIWALFLFFLPFKNKLNKFHSIFRSHLCQTYRANYRNLIRQGEKFSEFQGWVLVPALATKNKFYVELGHSLISSLIVIHT